MVLIKDITLHSLCEHHLLPFSGVAHIAYIPDGHILGLSKFARVVDTLSRNLNLQERLTLEIAEYLESRLKPQVVIVMLDCTHSCMRNRGVLQQKSTMKTIQLIQSDPSHHDEHKFKMEFYEMLKQ